MEADRRTVVVTLVEIHAEALCSGECHLGEQGRTVGVKQAIQRTAKPIIAEVIHLLRTDAKHPARKALDRLLLAANRPTVHGSETKQQPKAPVRRYAPP